MRKGSAALVSVIFFLAAPVMIAGAIPWSITRWQPTRPLPYGPIVQAIGALLILVGTGVLVHAFTRFVVEGSGTPAPAAPTSRLVVGGLYRYVRNPMYLAVLTVILGQAILLGARSLLGYGAVVGVMFVLFVRVYEEPTLTAQYGAEYQAYCRAVPAWWPRFRPWRGER